MRTDKKIADTVTQKEWKSIVEEHYADERQNVRIGELVDFVYDHCIKVSANKRATFSNAWGYLDVDKEHLLKFKQLLKQVLKASFINAKITYDKKGYDIIVEWREQREFC